MKSREEMQNSIFEKSSAAVRQRRQRRKTIGTAVLGVGLAAGVGICLFGNIFNRMPTVIDSVETGTINKPSGNIVERETKDRETKDGQTGTNKDTLEKESPENKLIFVSETAKSIAERTELSDKFIQNTADFSVELFQRSFLANKSKNVMISPLSALLALSMTANGADSETLSQMESVLGGELGIEEINQNLNSFVTGLYNGEKTKLFTADSIWIRNDADDFIVNPEFLETNRKYYYADAYAKPFNNETLSEMNQWISEKTDGMFQDIISELSVDSVMYLLNTMIFQGEWENIYYEDQVGEGFFTDYSKNEQKAELMYSREGLYLDMENGNGFLKPYENGYSFAALLPDEEVDIGEFIQSLNGEKFLKIMEDAKDVADMGGIFAALPKFSSRTSVRMNEVLQEMGIKQAFVREEADFSRMDAMLGRKAFISEVFQNSYISVNETGTQAGSVTRVAVNGTGVSKLPEIVLNRPFVYAIIDNQTKLPVYIGAMLSMEE